MIEALRNSTGERLDLADYWADFEKRFWETGKPGFWKLERQQTFKEPNEPSWRVFAAGDWDECIRLVQEKRSEFSNYYQRIADSGFINRRVRVVERPITAYLQWELHVLALRHEYGGLTRVVEAPRIAALEEQGPLPEIYTLGTDVMYEAVYDRDGVLEAANRFTDRTLIIECQRFIERLYNAGEPLDEFFARDVARLESPVGQ
ncbi:DUF6879 family protein [Allosalinactinospora lopnorensis]|uniref:DUF6879 family protein n=1 Tax=Allosalinactinospora lopnorensis TaxID=1352348 RepID=UPI000623C114|nr:DUF6879 family protein [Allosalinactinospora lopnorensis]